MESFDSPNKEYPAPKAGEPPLHQAARVGDHVAIRSLAAAGADVNAVFDIGLAQGAGAMPATPLMVAAGSGDGATDATVALLLELGADPTTVLEAQSAATFAFEGLGWDYKPGGDAARARRLLDAGSPLPKHPERLNLLLCVTAANGDAERLRVLLERGLNPKGHWDPVAARESYRRMMEDMAQISRSQEDLFASMPEELRASFAESRKELEAEMFEQHCSAPSNYEIPLFRAAESGSVECVRLLLAAGADSKVRDSAQCTAMYFAGSVEVVRALMQSGLSLEDGNKYGWTPLRSALGYGEQALPRVRALIEAGANVNATDGDGLTVFMSAVGTGRSLTLLRLLVASGADPRPGADCSWNAFHAAIDPAFGGRHEAATRSVFEYLKDIGEDIELRDIGNLTPLARAIRQGNGVEVRVLCELGADPNAVCPKPQCGGESCTRVDLPLLFHAADGIGGYKDVKTEALLRAGANPHAEDPDGFVPLELVVASLCQDAADYEDSYFAFFNGLRGLRVEGKPVPHSRDQYVADVAPVFRAYVEKFAGAIPIPEPSEFAEDWRNEKISCIVWLCAYGSWAQFTLGNASAS